MVFVSKALDKNQKMKHQVALRSSGTLVPVCDLLKRKKMPRWPTKASVHDLKWIIP